MSAALARDEEFWQSAYQKHGSAILAFLKVRLRNRQEAEDVLQETFVRAIRAADRLTDASKLRSFLFTIANHLMLNRIRDEKRRTQREKAVDQSVDAFPSPQQGPDYDLLMRSFQTRLNVTLHDMGPNLKKAFELALVQRRSYGEISAMTGWSMSSVKINVYRARKFAMKSLQEYLP